MINSITVTRLDSKAGEEIKSAIATLESSSEEEKVLILILDNTKGKHSIALKLAKLLTSTSVDVITISNGTLDPAGALIAAAGKKGERQASLDTVFIPFEKEENNSTGRLTPFNQSVLRGLSCLRGNRNALKNVALKNQSISISEAKKYRLIDKIDDFKRKDLSNSSTGTTARGNTARGNTARGNTARGNTARGNTARGNTARGNTARGNTARGNTARGNTARGNTARRTTR